MCIRDRVSREAIPTEGINTLQTLDIDYAKELGFVVKLLAIAERHGSDSDGTEVLDVRVHPTLVPKDHPLAGVNGVNNAILVEGEPVGRVMFYGPGAGAGPTASAVVADILNIAAIRQVGAGGTQNSLDPLLAASSWRNCRLIDQGKTCHRNYVRFQAADRPGVIGHIGSCFGSAGVSLQSIVQFETEDGGAEIVVVTHAVEERLFQEALSAILERPDVEDVRCCLRTL